MANKGTPQLRKAARATHLRLWRLRKGISQVDLGQQIGKSGYQIKNYEDAIVLPPISIAHELALFFDVSLQEFVEAVASDFERSAKGQPEDSSTKEEIERIMAEVTEFRHLRMLEIWKKHALARRTEPKELKEDSE